MVDGSELKRPQFGSLDVDGVINLNPAQTVPTLPATWGSVKAIYR